MSLWRDVADFALDHETLKHEQEQMEWIAREPSNPDPYYHLALLRRMQWKHDDAMGLLLHAISLNSAHAPSHVALAEIYAVRDDAAAAWRHARLAAQHGDQKAVEMLTRHKVVEPGA